MKKSKRLLSFSLCLVSIISLSPTAFAQSASVDPYVELRLSIYRQLEAQGTLYLYEHFENMFIPQNTTAITRNTQNWYAPNGGVLHYKYDWTYRDESGYVESTATYMDINTTNQYLADQFSTLKELLSFIFGAIIKNDTLQLLIAIYGGCTLIEDIYSRESIRKAGGYGRVGVVYDSISGVTSTVVVGWETYPMVTLNCDSAYNISAPYDISFISGTQHG